MSTVRRRARISPFAFDPLKPVPSVLEQTKWPCGFFQFPYRYKIQYFNPSLLDWLGRRYLVVRRRHISVHPGRNDIAIWLMDGNLNLLKEEQIIFPIRHPNENFEDPRAINAAGSFWLSYATFRAPWTLHHVHQGAAIINLKRQAIEVYHVQYGGNGAHNLGNTENEKNWVWFLHDGAMHFVYSPTPHVVVKTNRATVVQDWQEKSFNWRYGLPRGGTSPVLADGLYWSFFHSSLDINPDPPRRRYYLGVYAFQAKPPFKPVLYTRKPLLTGSEADPREPSAPLCVFPCGAAKDNESWLVTFGVNDCACAWIRIPHQEILRKVDMV